MADRQSLRLPISRTPLADEAMGAFLLVFGKSSATGV
jgi:hypothetical protein